MMIPSPLGSLRRAIRAGFSVISDMAYLLGLLYSPNMRLFPYSIYSRLREWAGQRCPLDGQPVRTAGGSTERNSSQAVKTPKTDTTARWTALISLNKAMGA